MAVRPIEILVNQVGDDRRRGKRMPLRCQARLIRKNGMILPTTTENLSSCGFYCHVEGRLTPGEEFDCYIHLPSNGALLCYQRVILACRGRVARVEALAGERFGIGCQIDDYLIVPE
jgi:hypothetical protein